MGNPRTRWVFIIILVTTSLLLIGDAFSPDRYGLSNKLVGGWSPQYWWPAMEGALALFVGICLLGLSTYAAYRLMVEKHKETGAVVALVVILTTAAAFVWSLPWRPLQWDDQRAFFFMALTVSVPLVWHMAFERMSGTRPSFFPNALGAAVLFLIVVFLGYYLESYGQMVSYFLSAMAVVMVWEGLIDRLRPSAFHPVNRKNTILAITVTLVVTLLSAYIGLTYGGYRWVS